MREGLFETCMHTAENHRLHTFIVTEHPNEEFGKIARVDELAKRLAGTRNNERGSVLWGEELVSLVTLGRICVLFAK